MGAAKAILVSDDALVGTDALGTAKVLAAAIKRAGEVDLVLTATESTDGYTGTVPAQVGRAARLAVAHLRQGHRHRRRQGQDRAPDREGLQRGRGARCPPWSSVTAGVVEPRYPSFKGIMAAKNKPVDEVSVADLGLDAGQVGWGGARQEITDVRQAEERQAGEKIEDEGDAHEKIVAFLEKLKVI